MKSKSLLMIILFVLTISVPSAMSRPGLYILNSFGYLCSSYYWAMRLQNIMKASDIMALNKAIEQKRCLKARPGLKVFMECSTCQTIEDYERRRYLGTVRIRIPGETSYYYVPSLGLAPAD